jgi:hypothetical protein
MTLFSLLEAHIVNGSLVSDGGSGHPDTPQPSQAFEYGLQPMDCYSPQGLSGYFDAYVQNTEAMQNTQMLRNTQAMQTPDWAATLADLRNQQKYLEDLLSGTAITLNALRDKQTRNQNALDEHPIPRVKRKKMQQNQWRTDKTVKTREKEERVILDCLRVCETNISTLESILYPTEPSSVVADYSWSASRAASSATDIDWNGWADAGDVSMFHRGTRRPASISSVPPEATIDEVVPANKTAGVAGVKPPPLPPRLQPELEVQPAVPPPPPNTARSTQCFPTLSPVAETFLPGSTKESAESEVCNKIDKLSISSLLASKHVQRLKATKKRRFTDVALGHLLRRLSEHQSAQRPSLERRRTSCWEEMRKTNAHQLRALLAPKRSISI